MVVATRWLRASSGWSPKGNEKKLTLEGEKRVEELLASWEEIDGGNEEEGFQPLLLHLTKNYSAKRLISKGFTMHLSIMQLENIVGELASYNRVKSKIKFCCSPRIHVKKKIQFKSSFRVWKFGSKCAQALHLYDIHKHTSSDGAFSIYSLVLTLRAGISSLQWHKIFLCYALGDIIYSFL